MAVTILVFWIQKHGCIKRPGFGTQRWPPIQATENCFPFDALKKFSSFQVYFLVLCPTGYAQSSSPPACLICQFPLSPSTLHCGDFTNFKIFFLSSWKVLQIRNLHGLKKIGIERVIIGLICSWRWPVNSLTDISFTAAAYGENAFLAIGEFFAAIPRAATVPVWMQGRVAPLYPVLLLHPWPEVTIFGGAGDDVMLWWLADSRQLLSLKVATLLNNVGILCSLNIV